MTLPAQVSPRVAALLEKARASRGRLIFAVDRTASREEAAKIGGLDVQLVHYGGDEMRHSPWLTDARELVRLMSKVRCMAGATQIAHVLQHVRAEHAREKVDAAVFIGDACEERPQILYAAAAGLGVPLFCFQEGDGPVVLLDRYGAPAAAFDAPSQSVETVFRELARLTNGAYAQFNASAAAKLAELLAAVVAFAIGGLNALGNLRSDSARKLLEQMR
jgi:hypothetical protein